MQYKIHSSCLNGHIQASPSKSHSLRAILLASLARGESRIEQVLDSPDVNAMIQACIALGARIQRSMSTVTVNGIGGKPHQLGGVIDAGNSGQVLRFIAAVSALGAGPITLTGDASICRLRPIKPYIDSLPQWGVSCRSLNNNGYAPIEIKGPMSSGVIDVDGRDSQIVSGLLIAATQVSGVSVINVRDPGEKPWVDLTLSWLDRLGVDYERTGYKQFILSGKTVWPGFHYSVPGDFSSLAYPVVTAMLSDSQITISNVDMDDAQGDKAFIQLLHAMGGKLDIAQDQEKTIRVSGGGLLKGQEIDINNFIDAITIAAVVGCFASGGTQITNGTIARSKESDRIAAICLELKKMGANIEERKSGLQVYPSRLIGALVDSHCDHRIALSLAVAGMLADGVTHIDNVSCVKKSYSQFVANMQQLGARLQVIR